MDLLDRRAVKMADSPEKWRRRARENYYRDVELSRARKRAATARWRAANPEKNRQAARKAYVRARNSGYFTAWREKNREKTRASCRSYAKRHPEKAAAKAAARRAAQDLRTPGWTDLGEIAAVYAMARALTVATGTLHHVDHDLPLLGKRVSGLHVVANLRVVSASVNHRKANTFEPE